MFAAVNLDTIKIPTVSFNVDDVLLKEFRERKTGSLSVDAILTKAVETNPKFKDVVEAEKKIETASKILDDISIQVESLQKTSDKNFKDIGDKQNEYHTEQMAEHQKTRDELLIDNGRLQEKIDNLQGKIKDGWKNPKNWPMGIIVSIVAGLIIWVVQYLNIG